MSALVKNDGRGVKRGLVVLRDLVTDPAGARKAPLVVGRSGSASESSRLRVVSMSAADVVDNWQ